MFEDLMCPDLQINILDGIQFKDKGGGRADLSLEELKNSVLWHNTKVRTYWKRWRAKYCVVF